MIEKDKIEEVVPTKTPTRWVLWFFAAFGILGAMMYFFFEYPQKNIGPVQPIAFSHRIHAGVKQIDCRFCHAFVAGGPNAGIPVMQKCFFCHQYVIPLHPEIRKERKYYETGKGVPWARVFYIPDHVQFHHQPHIRWAELDCNHCHGPVQKMDRLKSVAFRMGFCIGCHRKMNAQLDCWLACHH